MTERKCEKCGKDLRRKKVWAKHKSKVICHGCGYQEWAFWIDGTLYSRITGPNENQKAQIRK